MKANIPLNILVDTGFWFALYETGDTYHDRAKQMADVVEKSTVLIPWPSLYEVLNTEFTTNKIAIQRFEVFLSRPETKLIDDKIYREDALAEIMRLASIGKRQISLVDMVIRLILMNGTLKIDYLITFNEKDFTDVCKQKRIPILYES